MTPDPEALLAFWFGPDLDGKEAVAARCAVWFQPDSRFDERVRERFGELPALAATGALDAWRERPRSTLALVLVLDQLPRNLYRGDGRAFSRDPQAREVAELAIARGDEHALHPLEAVFLFLPLEHAEDPSAQERCVRHFAALIERAPAASRDQYEASSTTPGATAR